ncbi:MAG: hypothetical protein F6K50_26025 [Moorea sp. SIO3I7]|uniref:hypothetical protein n=1 Tax=Moorena sp. SIO3I8 TaxID=2607833 RepID=UPI0013C15380|nr:hypothetical protein [Moorena sp. SIO3I8]NEN98836.1 hypothetical protein [Moorena sp. SIO3I7]NEO09410.1 hypothetical protein [Moorena sp. SIO3I8]
MGILVEQASCLFHLPAYWWNRHLACFIFGHLAGMDILVEWASWWNGHVGGTGILPVSFPSGQDAHSTSIGGTGILPVSCSGILVEQASCLFHSRAGKMPTLLNWLFPIPDSRFPIPDSRFPIPDSLFPLLPKYLLNS